MQIKTMKLMLQTQSLFPEMFGSFLFCVFVFLGRREVKNSDILRSSMNKTVLAESSNEEEGNHR